MGKSMNKNRKKITHRINGFIILTVLLGTSFSCATEKGTGNSFSSEEIALMLQKRYREITEEILPVVARLTVVDVKTQILPEGEDFPFSPWHYGPFDPEENIPEKREFRNQGIGSGIIVREEGSKYYVLTNDHVVGDAEEIEVGLYNKKTFRGEVVGRDVRKDLALVVFESKNESIPVAVLGDSDELRVGDFVLAVGNPYGYESTVTSGIVSAIGRRGPLGNISDFIQTDAAINQGNSGGAMVNLSGEVIGINTWISTPTGGSIGLGFSIPINNAKKAINDFIAFGAIQYGWLGVSIAELLPDAAEAMLVDGISGAFIYHIFKGSPADDAGIRPGDYIIELGGEAIEGPNELVLLVGDRDAGSTLDYTLLRMGEKKTGTVRIGLRSEAEEIQVRSENLWPGIGVVPLTEDLRTEFAIPEEVDGVVVSEVEPNTRFQQLGVRFGDVLTEIEGKQIQSMLRFYKIIHTISPEPVSLRVFREERSILLAEEIQVEETERK